MAEAATTDTDQAAKNECVFCDIASGKGKGDIVYSDDEYVCFADIKPHAPHHYLIIPKQHYGNIKYLQAEHVTMIERMNEIGSQVLSEKNCDLSDSRFGFHWPPFQSIEHLHLHALSPVSSMGFLSRRIAFRQNYPLVSVEWALEYLKKQKL